MKTIYIVKGDLENKAFFNRADAEEWALATAEESLWDNFHYYMHTIGYRELTAFQHTKKNWDYMINNSQWFTVVEYEVLS